MGVRKGLVTPKTIGPALLTARALLCAQIVCVGPPTPFIYREYGGGEFPENWLIVIITIDYPLGTYNNYAIGKTTDTKGQ